jgi:hypothetical protein
MRRNINMAGGLEIREQGLTGSRPAQRRIPEAKGMMRWENNALLPANRTARSIRSGRSAAGEDVPDADATEGTTGDRPNRLNSKRSRGRLQGCRR